MRPKSRDMSWFRASPAARRRNAPGCRWATSGSKSPAAASAALPICSGKSGASVPRASRCRSPWRAKARCRAFACPRQTARIFSKSRPCTENRRQLSNLGPFDRSKVRCEGLCGDPARKAAAEEHSAMENAQHDLMRRQMIAEVVADAVFLTAQLGKSAFAARVIEVMGKIPRHEFVPLELRPYAYLNSPLPVGYGKTISQPFIIALMTDLLQPDPGDVALEVGAGVGYQAAILSELVKRVYSIEIIEELALDTRRRLGRLGYRNIEVGVGNGYYGWSEHSPFDKIIVTAAPDLIPPPLIAQLKPGGRMVIPTGIPDKQQLVLLEKTESGKLATREVLPVRFSELEEGDDFAGAA